MDSFFNHSRHDEMMRIVAPSVVPQSSTSVFFKIQDLINSDNDCDLPDNEDAVDLLKYLDCSEDVCNDLPSSIPTPAQIHYEEPTIPLSQLTTVLHSSEMNNDWMPKVKRETEDPAFNGWIPKSETEEDEFTKGLDLGLYSPSKFDIATGNDSDVDTESDKIATDGSISTDMFDATVPSTSTASTSRSTQAKNKVVHTARVISMPRPVGRPRGSKKKQQSVMTGHASTSNSASLPSCSKPEAENSTVSNPVVLGRGFFDHSRHDEMMPIFAPSVAPPSSTPVFFNIHDHINSDIDCDLPDNEDPVDLLKYLGCPEDVVCNDLPSSIPTPAQIHYDEPTIPLSQFTTVLHSSEMNNGWMRKLKRETEDPVINGWNLKSETEKDEFTKGLDLGLYSPSKFDITVPEIGIDIATGNDSDVDTESDKTATDGSISTDMFDTTVHSTSTASTSRSTQAKNKVVHTARGISMPRPVGRPRGSKKKQKSASTSKSASLPLGSKPEAENSTVSNPVVLGRGFFDHSRHDEMMPIFAPSVVPPSSTSVFFNIHDHINSDIDCDLPDNEHPVDLLKYLCCPEDVVCNDLPSSIPTPAQIHYDEPTIPLSQFTTVLHSSEMNNGWMRNLKRETEDPVINGWILKSETEEDEFTKGLDLGLYSPSKFDITVPEIEIDIATGNDSDVDTESDKMATDASISTDMFDTTAPSTSTASTSRSTQAKNKVVHTARVISMPRPVGRPRGSKKKQQSVMTGHASTSNSASLPSCSKPEAENSTVSNPVVLGRGFFDHSIHDEMMPIFAPLVVPPSSTSVFFNIHDHINSDIDCDLRDNEHPVDLLKYLGCPEDVVCYDLPSSIPTPAQIHYDEPTIPLSQLTTVLHSSEMNNGWMRKLKRETEDPVINGWILKSETEKDEFTKGLDLGLYSPSKFDITDPEIEIDIATGNDSDVDTESDKIATDASISTDMFDTTAPSTSTASTSRSTQAKNKVVHTARVISMPRPVGRPRGSKKKQQSVMTGHASTSNSASLPSCSKPEAENSTVSNPVVLGRGFFDHSRHDEMMPIFAPLVVPPSSTPVFFNIHDHINSDIDCDLRDNEHPVDLLKYLGCPEDVVCYDLPSSIPTPAQIHYDEPTIPLSQLTTVLHSSEMNNGWMRKLKRETEDPVINGWILKSETEKDEFTKGLDLGLYSPSKFDITDPEIEIDIATGNDSDVDTESDETATDASCLTDMFDTTVPSASTASTSSSTKAKSKVVYTAPVISMPRPVGRPRGRPPGSKKKQQSARTVQATTSKSASLPSCSKPEAENSTASKSVVLGRKRKLVKDDKTQSQPTYTQVPSTSITAKFYECALNPTASPPTTETAMPTIVARRTYRRNTVAVVDKEKQNHHNELERNRRQKLADLFTDLRDEVPNISCNPKASKVLILNEARFHILDLENTNKLQEEEASRVSQNQKLLKILLQQLQSKISGRVK